MQSCLNNNIINYSHTLDATRRPVEEANEEAIDEEAIEEANEEANEEATEEAIDEDDEERVLELTQQLGLWQLAERRTLERVAAMSAERDLFPRTTVVIVPSGGR